MIMLTYKVCAQCMSAIALCTTSDIDTFARMIAFKIEEWRENKKELRKISINDIRLS